MPRLSTGPLPLAAVLILALALRVWGLTWGLPSPTHYFSYHPDETVVLEHASLGMNVFAGQLLPHFYNYGSLQLYLVCIANTLAALFGVVDIVPKNYPAIGEWWPQWAKMYLIGRMLTVGMGVGTVWAVYAIGLRLWGRRAGLLSALTLAITPLHAQHSHFLTVDVPATFWGVLSLLWAVRLATGDARPLRAAIWAGVFAGLAAATKYNMALAILPLVAAWFVAPPLEPTPARSSPPLPKREGQEVKAFAFQHSSLTRFGRGGELVSRGGFLLSGLLAFVLAFCLACPGALLETGTFLADLRFEAVHVQNRDDPTFRDTGNGFVYHVTHNLSAGLGWPLLLLALVSVGYALYRRERGDGLLAAFALPYSVLISLAAVRYARYDIPLLPILALWTGRLLADGTRLTRPVAQKAADWGGRVVLVLTLIWCLRLVGFMATVDVHDWALDWVNNPANGSHAPLPATVAFPTMPWFGTAPVSPYFPYYQRGGWRRLTPPEDAARIVYNGKDWDADLLEVQKPTTVVLSEYDYDDALRLKDPDALHYLEVLKRDYRRRFVLVDGNPALSTQYTLLEGMPTRGWPHDMLYTNPIISLYQRKGN